MKNTEDELLEFYDHLDKKRQEKIAELEPYYERLENRIEARMNLYGIASPKENCLLRDLEDIANLEKKLKETKDINKLKTELEKDIITQEEQSFPTRSKQELAIITSYEELTKQNSSSKKI